MRSQMRWFTWFALTCAACGSDSLGTQDLPGENSGDMNSPNSGDASTRGDANGGEGDAGDSGASTGSSSGAATGGSTDGTSSGGSTGSSSTGSTGATSGTTTGGTSGATTGASDTACGTLLEKVTTAFSNVGTLAPCDQVVGGNKISASLLNLVGRTIDNEGETIVPCVEALCDSQYAYIAANAVPHYDFVRITPNALVETPTLTRIPLVPVAVTAQTSADPASSLHGCEDAYEQYLLSATTATTTEPSGFCALEKDPSYLYDEFDPGDKDYYQRIACLDAIALVSSGVSVYGPNEAATPDPWGNPGYNYPNDLITDTYGTGASLDLCGGHSGGTMHYHAVKDACFERNLDGTPMNTYTAATSDFDIEAALTDSCDGPSGIVGWAPDGYPIKGSCICVARDGAGTCTETRRARSAWAYGGLARWGSDAGESAVLGKESQTCASDTDCCTGQNCHYSCSFTVVNNGAAAGGSAAEKRCVLIDYSWCVHELHERADVTPSGVSFAYLDRCNGFDGPDGYAYHATMTFPFILGCYRGQVPTTDDWIWQDRSPGGGGGGTTGGSSTGGTGGPGGTTGPGGGTTGSGGGTLPMCGVGMTMMCCGDGVCDGPENASNCAADC